MKFKTLKIFFLILLIILIVSEAEAQCAMCKQVVESGKKNGSTAAEGINMAIFYLLSLPFLAVSAISFAFWRKWKSSGRNS